MAKLIKIPDERAEQLKQISEIKQKSISDLISDYIQTEIEAGTIPKEVPGIEVQHDDEAGTVTVDLGDGIVLKMTKAAAAANASDIRRLASPSDMLTSGVPEFAEMLTSGMPDLTSGFVVSGRNNTIAFKPPYEETRKFFAKSVAKSIADLMAPRIKPEA